MVQDQGLDVYLAPFGNINERYQQHAVPEGSPAFTGDPNEVYIEAVDEERFIIVANLLEDLETKGATHLQFNHEIDQARDASGTTTCMSLTELERQGSKHMNLKGRHTMATTIRKVDGAWSRCGFVFAFLVMGTFPASLSGSQHQLTIAQMKNWTCPTIKSHKMWTCMARSSSPSSAGNEKRQSVAIPLQLSCGTVTMHLIRRSRPNGL
jgi:hypothetical protein